MVQKGNRRTGRHAAAQGESEWKSTDREYYTAANSFYGGREKMIKSSPKPLGLADVFEFTPDPEVDDSPSEAVIENMPTAVEYHSEDSGDMMWEERSRASRYTTNLDSIDEAEGFLDEHGTRGVGASGSELDDDDDRYSRIGKLAQSKSANLPTGTSAEAAADGNGSGRPMSRQYSRGSRGIVPSVWSDSTDDSRGKPLWRSMSMDSRRDQPGTAAPTARELANEMNLDQRTLSASSSKGLRTDEGQSNVHATLQNGPSIMSISSSSQEVSTLRDSTLNTRTLSESSQSTHSSMCDPPSKIAHKNASKNGPGRRVVGSSNASNSRINHKQSAEGSIGNGMTSSVAMKSRQSTKPVGGSGTTSSRRSSTKGEDANRSRSRSRSRSRRQIRGDNQSLTAANSSANSKDRYVSDKDGDTISGNSKRSGPRLPGALMSMIRKRSTSDKDESVASDARSRRSKAQSKTGSKSSNSKRTKASFTTKMVMAKKAHSKMKLNKSSSAGGSEKKSSAKTKVAGNTSRQQAAPAGNSKDGVARSGSAKPEALTTTTVDDSATTTAVEIALSNYHEKKGRQNPHPTQETRFGTPHGNLSCRNESGSVSHGDGSVEVVATDADIVISVASKVSSSSNGARGAAVVGQQKDLSGSSNGNNNNSNSIKILSPSSSPPNATASLKQNSGATIPVADTKKRTKQEDGTYDDPQEIVGGAAAGNAATVVARSNSKDAVMEYREAFSPIASNGAPTPFPKRQTSQRSAIVLEMASEDMISQIRANLSGGSADEHTYREDHTDAPTQTTKSTGIVPGDSTTTTHKTATTTSTDTKPRAAGQRVAPADSGTLFGTLYKQHCATVAACVSAIEGMAEIGTNERWSFLDWGMDATVKSGGAAVVADIEDDADENNDSGAAEVDIDDNDVGDGPANGIEGDDNMVIHEGGGYDENMLSPREGDEAAAEPSQQHVGPRRNGDSSGSPRAVATTLSAGAGAGGAAHARPIRNVGSQASKHSRASSHRPSPAQMYIQSSTSSGSGPKPINKAKPHSMASSPPVMGPMVAELAARFSASNSHDDMLPTPNQQNVHQATINPSKSASTRRSNPPPVSKTRSSGNTEVMRSNSHHSQQHIQHQHSRASKRSTSSSALRREQQQHGGRQQEQQRRFNSAENDDKENPVVMHPPSSTRSSVRGGGGGGGGGDIVSATDNDAVLVVAEDVVNDRPTLMEVNGMNQRNKQHHHQQKHQQGDDRRDAIPTTIDIELIPTPRDTISISTIEIPSQANKSKATSRHHQHSRFQYEEDGSVSILGLEKKSSSNKKTNNNNNNNSNRHGSRLDNEDANRLFDQHSKLQITQSNHEQGLMHPSMELATRSLGSGGVGGGVSTSNSNASGNGKKTKKSKFFGKLLSRNKTTKKEQQQ